MGGTHSTTHGVSLRLGAEAVVDQGLEDHQAAAEVEDRPQEAEDHLILGDQGLEGRLAVEEVEAHLQEAADRQIHGRESQDHRAVCSGVRTFSAWTSSMGT